MSFRSLKLELNSFAPELNILECGIRLNRSYQHLLAAHPWSFLRAEALVTTVIPYSTGTVSVASGSTTVTGASTVWTATMAGRFIRFGGQSAFHLIASVNAVAQTLTLSQAYGNAVLAAESYTIFQHQYTLPTGARDIIGVRYESNLGERTKTWLDTIEPDRTSVGQPVYWSMLNETTLELWPVPDAVYMIRVWYHRTVSDLSAESDAAEVPERLLLVHARKESYLQLASRPEGAHYLKLYQAAVAEFGLLWQAAEEDDMRKLSLPTCVLVDGVDFPVSNQFWYSHDVLDPRGNI